MSTTAVPSTHSTTTAGTPPVRAGDRELWIDTLRAGALLIVVVGHWLMAALTLRGSGADVELGFTNILEISSITHLLTWPLQVMPVFFAAGAYVVARKHLSVPTVERSSHGVGRQGWAAHMAARTRQLVLPTVPLLGLWWLATPALTSAFGAPTVRAAGGAAIIPLWFLSTYLVVQSMTPALIRIAERFGVARPIALSLALTLAIDTAHHVMAVPGIGYVNFATVWAIPTLLGIGLALRGYRPTTLLVAAAAAFALAVVLIQTADYVIPVVGAAAAEGRGNTSPPSTVLALHGVAYTCLALAVGPRLEGWLRSSSTRRRALRTAAAVSMPLYLWHMTAMVALVALVVSAASAGFAVPGVTGLLEIQPLTSMWWATRPLWIALNACAAVAVLAVVKRPSEWLVRFDQRRLIGASASSGQTAVMVACAVAGIGVIVTGAQPVSATGGALVITSLAVPTVWRR